MSRAAPDWPAILAPRGRWSALVQTGSTPALVARHAAARAVFLAAPYLSDVAIRQEWRVERSVRLGLMAAREVMRLRLLGVTALCPVVMQAAMCEAACLLPEGPEAMMDRAGWDDWSAPMLGASNLIVVPDIQGWDRCPAILGQVASALGRNVAVHVYAGGAS